MGTADHLLEEMFSWIEKRERCADKLMKLAQELESLREKCNAGECVGSSVLVMGCVCMIGAGVATLLTGGAAAPLLGAAAAAYTGTGVAISVGAKITEHFLSSDTLKEAQKAEKESNQIQQKIQQLFEELKAEKKEVNSFADPEKLDQHISAEILTAIARRNGLKAQFNISSFNNEPPLNLYKGKIFSDERHIIWGRGRGSLSQGLNLYQVEMALKVGLILGSFSLTLSSVKCKGAKTLADFGAKALTTYGLKTGITKGTLVAGGAATMAGGVGMVFALSEAIENWTDLIKENHVTKASKSLRDTADKIRNAMKTLKEQFDNIKNMLETMPQNQQDQEELHLSEEKTQDKTEDTNRLSEEEEEEQLLTTKQRRKKGIKENNSQNLELDWEILDLIEFLVFNKPDRRWALLNFHSIKSKDRKKKMVELLKQKNLDVLILTETWLDSGDEDLREALPPNYSFCHWSREGRRGGGVAIIFSNERLEGTQINLTPTPTQTFEHVAVKLQHREWDQPVLVISVYRPPGGNSKDFKTFCKELKNLLKQARAEYKNILLTGDFNIWVDDKSNKSTDEFDTLLEEHGLTQHVKGPTQQAGHTLDLVIGRRNVEISDLIVWNDNISDHYTVYFNAKPVSGDSEKDTKANKDDDEQTKLKKE